MRLQRLDLTRYGKFTDQSIDFGAVSAGVPDLHILFGANEAGKSTLASAWLDLLFGIPERSPMGFLHSTLRIGARLDLDGQEIEIARIKARQASLLGANDLPLPEAVLLAHLPVKDRESYAAMFWLDDETIEEGGNSILASKGELGEMLFASTAGLTGLSARLTELREGSDRFYRKQARNTRLAEFRTRLDEIEAKRRAVDVQAADYARLTQIETAARQDWLATEAEAQRLRSALALAERGLAAAPARARLALCEDRIADLRGYADPPPGWLDRVMHLETDLGQWRAQQAALSAQNADFLMQASTLQQDPAVLHEEARFAAAAALVSAHAEAVKDLPARREMAAKLHAGIARLLALLGRSGLAPETTALPPDRIEALRRQQARWSGLANRVETARTELRAASAELQAAQAAEAQQGGGPASPALAPLLHRLRLAAPEAALRQAERERQRIHTTLGQRLEALAPWSGDLAALRRLELPQLAEFDRWLQQDSAALQDLQAALNDLARLAQQIDATEAELAARSDGPQGASAAQLAAARTRREALWATHRAHLTPDSAAAFEAALREDDALQAQRAAAAAEDAHVTGLRVALARLLADQRAALASKARAEATRAEVRQRLPLGPGGLPAGLTPSLSALRDWMARRDDALQTAPELAQAEAACAAARQGLAQAQAALAAALGAPPATPFDQLWDAAELGAEQTARRAAVAERLAAAQQTRDRRRAELDAAETALADWRQAQAALVAGSWLAELAPDGLAEVVEWLGELGPLLANAAELDHRIRAMAANQSAFEQCRADLAQALGTPHADWPTLTDRRRHAELAAARAAQIAASQHSIQVEITLLATRITEAEASLQAMAQGVGLGDATALRGYLEKAAARARLEYERDRLQDDILTALGMTDLAAALDRLATTDPAQAEADLARLRAAAEEQAAASQRAFAALSAAQAARAGVGSDDAAARLEGARMTVLLELAEAATDHLRSRFGVLAVDQALRGFRDSHRGPMMQAAGQAFAAITGGAYQRLATQPEKDRETLIAIARDGASKPAASLSKGTRFQLYLALRIAAYHEMAARGDRPGPFWADDILETFDERRSGAALEQFAAMAQHGQVIYLTHHQHVVDLALRHCPGVKIHSLNGQAAQA